MSTLQVAIGTAIGNDWTTTTSGFTSSDVVSEGYFLDWLLERLVETLGITSERTPHVRISQAKAPGGRL